MDFMDYLQMANSPAIWIACAIPVLLIAVQAIIFVRRSLTTAKRMGITDHQINSAVRSSAIASFGPSVVVAIGALGLVLAMGGPISWLRLSFIGAVQYELTAATFGAQAAGATFDSMTPVAFANGVWTMTICSVGWLLMTVLFAKKFDKMTHIIAGNSIKSSALFPSALCWDALEICAPDAWSLWMQAQSQSLQALSLCASWFPFPKNIKSSGSATGL